MNNMIDGDDGKHPMSPLSNERLEKNHEYDPDEKSDNWFDETDQDPEHLDEFTNEELLQELESRFRHMGYISLPEVDKIKFLFQNMDKITLEGLEWLAKHKHPLQ